MPEAVTPMMRQYFEIKNQHKDKILFYRLGDFYEMFFDDALVASRVLDLTLTGKNVGTPERAPMCGVPFHSYEAYVARLIARGYKVAICEQTEDPAKAKGLVSREVVRVITPGTLTESSMLREDTNNFICAIYRDSTGTGLSFCDISTGESYSAAIPSGSAELATVINECGRYAPREAVLSDAAWSEKNLVDFLEKRLSCAVEQGGEWRFTEEQSRKTVSDRFPDAENVLANACICRAMGGLLSYLFETQKTALEQLKAPEIYEPDLYMTLDHTARTNLELFETLRTHEKQGSLLWVLDHTSTSMGARLLRRRLEQPLLNPAAIRRRLNAVAALHDDAVALSECENALRGVSDLERLISRVVCGTANARDLRALAATASRLPALRGIVSALPGESMREITAGIEELADLRELIDSTLADDVPVALTEGKLIRAGYSEELDALRGDATDGRDVIATIQNRERERTGIKNLKVGYNKVFGYYIEVTPSYQHLVPDDYIRRQTLTTAERYVTEELKQLEGRVLGAQDRANNLEYEIFCKLRERVAAEAPRVRRTASAVAALDVTASLARVAVDNGYVMPEVDLSDALDITDGRHPVVEQYAAGFVPNDTHLDCSDHMAALITGPNMAGKSTYMRQTAIIALMAQIGSFVPAKSARIGVCDRIFTRIGASDDLSGGQSTFMVEMSEVADILAGATKKSLIILDEIGRGTSTYDGMSIARAVLEHVVRNIGARTMFATHYHELTELADKLRGVVNMSTAVRKRGDEITFLHRIIAGGADDSYGIEVAKLAGVPDEVIRRAKQILKSLERGEEVKIRGAAKPREQASLADLGAFEIVERIRGTDLDSLTPVAALNLLYELKIMAERLP